MESESDQVLTPLTETERRELLHLARASIAAALHGTAQPTIATATTTLRVPCGVFVSLHVRGQLRGCVGTLATDRPLFENVMQLAVAAAFDDPRFPPLGAAELSETAVEISRLSNPTRTHPEGVIPERHGVCAVRGAQRGVLLPQVAQRYGWDRERLLAELCHKAHLPADAWRDPDCELFCFEAEVFSDEAA